MSEDRLKGLQQRLHQTQKTATPTKKTASRQAGIAPGRVTLYLKDTTVIDAIDQAYKDTAHALYPQEIEKADYLGACFRFVLANQDKIQMLLASHADDSQ